MLIQILIALRFYAVGCYQRAIGQDLFLAVSQPTVSRCVTRVSKCIADVFMNEVIKFPVTEQEEMANKIGYSSLPNICIKLGYNDTFSLIY